jgi:hypothetical protein
VEEVSFLCNFVGWSMHLLVLMMQYVLDAIGQSAALAPNIGSKINNPSKYFFINLSECMTIFILENKPDKSK